MSGFQSATRQQDITLHFDVSLATLQPLHQQATPNHLPDQSTTTILLVDHWLQTLQTSDLLVVCRLPHYHIKTASSAVRTQLFLADWRNVRGNGTEAKTCPFRKISESPKFDKDGLCDVFGMNMVLCRSLLGLHLC